jgi:TolB-like protein/Flp pilus assembly protein TadD/DNA-binding winged helix-turn-helix (wHTH) protein
MQVREGFRLDDLIVGPSTGHVLRPDGRQRLPVRAAEALVALAEQPGLVVTRTELHARLWPDGSGSDESLVRCIGELRHALGDRGRTHRYVETVARQGYRLVLEPAPLTAEERARLEAVAGHASTRAPWWHRVLRTPRARRTFGVVASYTVIAFGVMQFVTLIVQQFGLSQQISNFAIVLGVAGVLPAAAFAWRYRPASPSASGYPRPAHVAGFGAMAVAVAALVTLMLPHPEPDPPAPQKTPVPERSIAVLPFVNMSGDPAADYLGDGLADEIANRLTRVPGLAVASRTSAFTHRHYADRDAGATREGDKGDAPAIATDLGVRYLLEGSIRREGNDLRITAQLIDGPSNQHRWSKTYERRKARDFDVEDDIAGSVLEALKIVLSPEQLQRLRERPTENFDAYDLYRKGISVLRNSSVATALDQAVRLFMDAVRLEPTYAEAHAALCETHVKRFTFLRDPAALLTAQESCEQALRLDKGLPEVHLAYGSLYTANGQHADAERQYRKAIELKPEFVEAQLGLASTLAAMQRYDEAEATFRAAQRARPRYWMVHDKFGSYELSRGRPAEARKHFRRAVDLQPQNATLHSNVGAAYFLEGDFPNAAEAFRRSVELAPTSEGYSNTGTTYFYAGNADEAVRMFEQAAALTPQDYVVWGNLGDAQRYSREHTGQAGPSYARATGLARAHLGVNPEEAVARTLLAYFLARQGESDAAKSELAQVSLDETDDYYVHYYAALVHHQLGDIDAAIKRLGEAVAAGFPRAVLRAAPELDGLQTDSRVVVLLEEPAKEATDTQTGKGGDRP